MEKILNKNLHNHYLPIFLLVIGVSLFIFVISYSTVNLSGLNPINRVFFTADFKLSKNTNGSYSIVPNNQNTLTYQPNYLVVGQNTILQTSLIH